MIDLDEAQYQERLEEVFASHGVALAYLFGSQARGRPGPLSDVDIAVLLGPEVGRDRWFQVKLDLIGALMELFRRNDIDVVVLNRATPVMAHEVARSGRILYEAKPGTRVAFEVSALRRYVDTKPLRRIQDQHLLDRAEEYRAAMREGGTHQAD